MNHTPIPYFNGVDKDNPARIIPENRCQDASNVTFEDMLVKTRFGYLEFSDLTDPIMALIYYEKPYEEDTFLVAVTTRDFYVYNHTTTTFDLVTRNYSTGVVTCGSGTTTVSGVGTEWGDVDLAGSATYYQIGFGSNSITSISTWYDIASITNDTALELSAALTSGVTSVQYVIRMRMAGTADDLVSYATPYDDTIGDKCLLVTNGIDNIQYWDGIGSFEDVTDKVDLTCTVTDGSTSVTTTDTSNLYDGMTVTGTSIVADTIIADIPSGTEVTLSASASVTLGPLSETLTFGGLVPNKTKHISYFGSVGYEHTISTNITESAEQRPMTVELTNAGTLLWKGIYYDLLNDDDELQGVVSLQNRLIFYKKSSLSEAWMTGGGNTDPLDFIQNKVNVGTPAIRTVVDIENYHIFMSYNGIYAYDGNSAIHIDTGIVRYFLGRINKPTANRSFAFAIKRLNLYCLFVPTEDSADGYPDLCLVYNYVEKSWTIWEMNDPIYCFGKYRKRNASTLTWAQYLVARPTTTWALINPLTRWRDMVVQADDETFLLGDGNGKVMEFGEEFLSDNGTNIVSTFTTRDYPLNDQKHAVRLNELVLGFRDISGTNPQCQVEASVDFGETWSDPILLDMDVTNNYYEDIANFIMRGVQVRFRITNYSGASFSIENMNIGWNAMGVKR